MNSCFGYITRLKGGKGDKRDSAPKPRVLRAVRYTNKFDLGAFHVGPKEFEIVMGNPLFLIKASTEEAAFPFTSYPLLTSAQGGTQSTSC